MAFRGAIIAELLATGTAGTEHIEISSPNPNGNRIDFFAGDGQPEAIPAGINEFGGQLELNGRVHTLPPNAAQLILAPDNMPFGDTGLSAPGKIIFSAGSSLEINTGAGSVATWDSSPFVTVTELSNLPSFLGAAYNPAVDKLVMCAGFVTANCTAGTGRLDFALPVTYSKIISVSAVADSNTGDLQVTTKHTSSAGDVIVCNARTSAGVIIGNGIAVAVNLIVVGVV